MEPLIDEFPTEPEQIAERNRLHEIIKRLVIWQNSNEGNFGDAEGLLAVNGQPRTAKLIVAHF